MEAKDAVREAARRARVRLPGLDGASAALRGVLKPWVATARTVASYVPVGAEPGVAPEPGWLLPVLLPDGDLDWAAHDGRLVTSPRGLQEPAGPRLGVAAVAGCDLVLVPALRVDRWGNRLGRGGGSYDRALARATGFVVALLHDGELVEQLPVQAHDRPVHAVATPTGGLVRLPRP